MFISLYIQITYFLFITFYYQGSDNLISCRSLTAFYFFIFIFEYIFLLLCSYSCPHFPHHKLPPYPHQLPHSVLLCPLLSLSMGPSYISLDDASPSLHFKVISAPASNIFIKLVKIW